MIREATPNDVPTLVELGGKMHAESPYWSRWKFSPQRLDATLRTAIETDHGMCVVVEDDGQIQAGIAALAMPHWSCEMLQACDLALFVDPLHRGGLSAVRLIKAYLHWCDHMGAVPVMGITTGVDMHRTERLFGALGGEQTGSIWTWRI